MIPMEQNPPAGTVLTAAIDDARIEAGMTFADLATSINMDEQTLRSHMASGGSFRVLDVQAIARVLGINFAGLIDGVVKAP